LLVPPVTGTPLLKSHDTVWYMCTRIRATMNNEEFKELMGIVEVDDLYRREELQPGRQ
jgi:hypothetical protein